MWSIAFGRHSKCGVRHFSSGTAGSKVRSRCKWLYGQFPAPREADNVLCRPIRERLNRRRGLLAR
jgi:hypothetical protein